MENRKLKIPPEFISATREEQLAFIQELSQLVDRDPEKNHAPEHWEQMLQERLNAHHANPPEGKSWDQVREELLEKFYSESLNEKPGHKNDPPRK